MGEKFGRLPPIIEEFMKEYLSDKRGILFPVGNIQAQAIDLSAARVKERIEIQGDFIFADSDTTGVGYLRFNNSSMPAMPFRTNTGVYGFPIKEVFLTNAAQSGLVLNLWYGYGVRVIPPNQDITTIGSITTPVSIAPYTYGASFISSSALAGSTNEAMVAPASNVAGMDLQYLGAFENPGGGATDAGVFLAKASAPASNIDGVGIMYGQVNSRLGRLAYDHQMTAGHRERGINIPLGLGLYFRSGAGAQVGAWRTAHYTL